MGVAFDGDADRCLAVDGEGNMVNGDQIMGILARAKKNAGKLNHDTLVVTVMSNLGLKLALRSMGIKTVQTGVGDRYVLEEMLRGDYSLGGEQSGHVINREFATTGDGTLTALTLCNEVVNSGKSLKELASDFPQLPQTLINVPNVDKLAAKTNAKVQAPSNAKRKCSATPAACYCVPPAPNRSCASWLKRKPSSRPTSLRPSRQSRGRRTRLVITPPIRSIWQSKIPNQSAKEPHVWTQLESQPRTQPRGRKTHQNRRQGTTASHRAGR